MGTGIYLAPFRSRRPLSRTPPCGWKRWYLRITCRCIKLSATMNLPLCLSERLMTRYGFRELLENRAARIIMPDISWCGGISEAKKIASMAETYYLPVAPHNCGGPVLHVASAHLAANLTNLYILETVRRHYMEEYRGIVTNTLRVIDGAVPLPPGPGLGVDLEPAALARPDAVVERTEA